MRLKRFTVKGLFGLFNHEIPFRLHERITIIHAPNGFGKTVILKLISTLFAPSFALYRKIEFSQVLFEFDNGSTLVVDQRKSDDKDITNPTEHPKFYKFTYKAADDKHFYTYDPWAKSTSRPSPLSETSSYGFEYLPEFVPFLEQAGEPGHFIDKRTNKAIGQQEALEKYHDYLPSSIRTRVPDPTWLTKLRSSFDCRLVETQRLMTIRDARRDARPFFDNEPPTIIPAVRTNSRELAALLERTLAHSATLSQSLDRTFPNRLLRGASRALSEIQLRQRLAELEQRRSRLTTIGLLDKSDESAFIPSKRFDGPTRKILTEYVSDAQKKLDVFEGLLPKIELLTEIINSRFQFKRLTVDRKEGFKFLDIKEQLVDLESLSSGEQHELVLLYDLLFKTKKDTLLLIDEPEISLHIAWQKQFLSDLQRIIELSPMDIVLATHSPQLIGGHLSLTTQLAGPT